MTQQLAPNTKNWKIKTNTGFVPFVGVSTMGIKHLYRITFEDGTFVDASANHVFFTEDGREISVKEMSNGLTLLGVVDKTITSITHVGEDETYDIIESKTHTFFANGLLSHNCIFLSSDALLISSLILNTLIKTISAHVHETNGIKFWKEIKPNGTYLIGVDPATGSGNDFSTIEVFEFPSLEQVAEYRSNTTSSPMLYTILKFLLRYIEKRTALAYFSIENNGIGEGLISLYQADETPPQAEFISEDGAKRLGMTTTKKTKVKACISLKQLIEQNKIKIVSKLLLQELKTFARTGESYQAQPGSTDDAVSATLIITRLLHEISTYEQDAFNALYSYDESEYIKDEGEEYDNDDEPTPMIF